MSGNLNLDMNIVDIQLAEILLTVIVIATRTFSCPRPRTAF